MTHLDGVVGAAGDDVVSVGTPVDADDALEVTLQEHDALSRPEVPHPPERVHPARGRQRTVALEGQAVHRLAVALLVEHFLQTSEQIQMMS